MRDKSHTDFILDAAHLAAEETLLNQMRIITSRETYSEFLTRLEQPVVVDEDGTTHFFEDIYGHDARLDAVLAKGPPYPYPTPAPVMVQAEAESG